MKITFIFFAGLLAAIEACCQHAYITINRNLYLADSLADGFQYKEAIKYYSNALELSGENKAWPQKYRAFAGMANAFTELTDFTRAKTYLDSAGSLLNSKYEIIPDSLNGHFFSTYAAHYRTQGKYRQAIESLEKSLAHYQASDQLHKKEIATIYNQLGANYGYLGDTFNEIPNYEKALQLKLDVYGPSHESVAGTYNDLGSGYQNIGDHGRALTYYYKTLQIDLESLGEGHPFIAQDYNNISSALEGIGEYEQSIEVQLKSQEIYRTTLGEDHVRMAIGYNNLGQKYSKLGNYHQQIKYLQQALQILNKRLAGDHSTKAIAQYNLAHGFLQTGKLDAAIAGLRSSLKMMRKTLGENHFRVGVVHNKIANYHLQKNELEDALKHVQLALNVYHGGYDINDHYSNPDYRYVPQLIRFIEALNTKALIFNNRYTTSKDIDDALFSLETSEFALEVINKVRKEFHRDASTLAFNEQMIGTYEQAIAMAVELYQNTSQQRYLDKAFHYSEESKSFLLFLSLRRNQVQHYSHVPDSIVDREDYLKKSIAYRRSQQTDAEVEGSEPDRLPDILGWQTELDSLFDLIRNNYPEYFRLTYEAPIARLSDIGGRLTEEQVLIEYFYGDSSIYVFSVHKESTNVFKLRRKELAGHIDRLIKSTTDYDFILESSDQADSIYLHTSTLIFEKLISPAIRKNQSIKSLIFCLDGPLHLINPEIILTGPGDEDYRNMPYLIRDYSVSLTPSASIRLYPDTWNQNSPSTLFGGFVPEYGSDNHVPSTPDTLTGYFAPPANWSLEEAIEEVQTSAGLFDGHLFSGTDASESAFKKEAGNYQLLHLAMHGFLGDGNDEGRLLFSTQNDRLNDGYLMASEIYGLDLNADLVTLSACYSGAGKVMRGEGVMSLSRAFMYTGVPSVIMSLWALPDGSTSNIVTDFYGNLKKSQAIDEALRNAKLSYLNSQDLSFNAHPFFWAGLIPIGETSAVDIPSRISLSAPMGIGMIIVCILVILINFRKQLKLF